MACEQHGVSTGRCKICRNAYLKPLIRRWYERNRDAVLAKAAERRRTDPAFREAAKQRSHDWYILNKDKMKARRRERGEPRSEAATERRRQSAKLRQRHMGLAAVARMGGKCEACGNSDERVLQFDHRKPVGRSSRKMLGVRVSTASHREVLKSDRPSSVFALLCANCHIIKTRENREYVGRRGLTPPADENAAKTLH